MRPTSRRTAAVLSLSALVLGATACGADEPDAQPAAGAAEETSSSPSETPTEAPGSSEPTPAAPDTGAEVAPEALLDRMKAAMGETTSARFTMDVAGQGQEIAAEGALSYAEGGNEMDLSMSLPGGGRVRVLAADGELFASVPGQTPQGKFVRIDPDDPGMGALADQVESMDPLSSFDAFDAGLKKVTFVGEERLGGDETERYRLEVDSAAAAEAQGEQPPAGVPETVTYDLWLDDEDHMRQITFDLAGLEAVMTMSQWGEPVDITAPPAWNIIEMPSAGS